ncbi:MAG TPA: PEP-CTERM sorting domain-containing protein [Candidatus Dormibacteraeota bacterium]|nr:PEP-CTERM sorting domain-containing protein [Candidatus Dormibacteraeota bacterium]
MNNATRILVLVAAAAVLAFAPSSKADSVMTLTGAGNNPAFNVYIGPYTASIDGTSTQVICDDFSHDSFLNESWNASVTNLATVATGAPSFNAGTGADYSEAAWLTLQLPGVPNNSQATAIQYAIWDLFDPSGVSSYLAGFSGGTSFLGDSTDVNGVQYWLNEAAGSSLSGSQLADFLIYTPTSCVSGQCLTGSSLPQEFIVYTPEPSTVLMLLMGLAALLWFKRRDRVLNLA